MLIKHFFLSLYVKNKLTKWLHGLQNSEVQCRIQKGTLITPILDRINPIDRIDSYFSKFLSNIFQGLVPCRFTFRILKEILPFSILNTCPAQALIAIPVH